MQKVGNEGVITDEDAKMGGMGRRYGRYKPLIEG
jgi:hypothetical protein